MTAVGIHGCLRALFGNTRELVTTRSIKGCSQGIASFYLIAFFDGLLNVLFLAAYRK